MSETRSGKQDFSEASIQQSLAAHEMRNASLQALLEKRQVDVAQSRRIDFHFWSASSADADRLVRALQSQGFRILVHAPTTEPVAALRWNVEAEADQSVELTTRRDFTEGLIRLAAAHNSTYDGWGTLI